MNPHRFRVMDVCGKAAGLAFGLLSGAAAGGAGPAPAKAPDAAGATASFDAFKLIGNLNIFDSTRVGWVDEAPKAQVDSISLVGTMDYEKGPLAFFDGSDRSYRKALRTGGTIADFTVTRINSGGVELTRNSKSIPLQMGQQLRRPAGEDWTVGAASPRAAAAPAPAAAAAAQADVSADTSDVLKRLMAQRQQQLKQ